MNLARRWRVYSCPIVIIMRDSLVYLSSVKYWLQIGPCDPQMKPLAVYVVNKSIFVKPEDIITKPKHQHRPMFSAKEIALRYGDDVRIAHVIIRDSSVPSALNTDFTSDEIMKTLNMDSLYTCVLALRDEKDRSREFKLTEAPNHSMSTSLLPRRFLTNSQVRNLREDTVYQIISECIIDDIVQSLPDEKKLTIIEEFKKLDLDGSGYIGELFVRVSH